MRPLLLAVFFIVAAGCARFATYPLQPTRGLVTRPPSDAHACIVRGLLERGYVIESESGNVVIARHAHGRRSLRLSIEIGPDTYVVRHLDSDGYGYGHSGDSEHVDRNYNRAMDELHLAIQGEMSRPSRPTGPIDSNRAVSSGGQGQTIIVLQVSPSGGGSDDGSRWQGMTCEQVVESHGLGRFEQDARCRPSTNAGCADAVLSTGLPSTDIFFCNRIRDTGCARAHILGGGPAVSLARCR